MDIIQIGMRYTLSLLYVLLLFLPSLLRRTRVWVCFADALGVVLDAVQDPAGGGP